MANSSNTREIEVISVSPERTLEDGRIVVFLGVHKHLEKAADRTYKLNGAFDKMITVKGNEELISDLRSDLSDGSGEPVVLCF